MRLTLTSEKLKARTDGVKWDNAESCDHWRCTLMNGDKELVFEFSAGAGHEGKAPGVKDVLPCLISDAWSARNHDSYEDWCDEVGGDPDSRYGERMWLKMKREADALEEFLGSDEFELAMNIGDDQYARIRTRGEDAPDWKEWAHATEWRDVEYQGKTARVRVLYDVDLDFAEETRQDPGLSVELQGQVRRHGVWINQYLEISGPPALTEREALFLRFSGFRVTTGPVHYVQNALYRYKQSIGLEPLSNDDRSRWQQREFNESVPEGKDQFRWGARQAFLRTAMFGVLESEPPFPAVVDAEDATIPLSLEEMVENMQVWLELRIPCLVHQCQALMHEFGMPVDMILGRAKSIERQRLLAGTPAKKPKPKLVHTIGPQDVGRNYSNRACCGECGKKQPAIHLTDSIGRVQKGDIGKRVYLVWAHANSRPIIQVENDKQRDERLERRKEHAS